MSIKSLFRANVVVDTPNGDIKVSYASAVPTLQHKKNSNSVMISVKPEKATTALHGYTFFDEKISEICGIAEEKGVPVLLRFETVRKSDIDKSISILELTKDIGTAAKSVNKCCSGVYDFNNGKWVLVANASDPDNDPEELKRLINEVKETQVSTDDFFKEPATNRVPDPWILNKQSQLITMYFTVVEYEKKYGYTLEEEKRQKIARLLLKLSDEIQKILKGADVVNYKDYSHTKARQIVFSYEGSIKALDNESIKDVKTWCKECLAFAKTLCEWTKE